MSTFRHKFWAHHDLAHCLNPDAVLRCCPHVEIMEKLIPCRLSILIFEGIFWFLIRIWI